MVMADVKVSSVAYEKTCCGLIRSRFDDTTRPLLGKEESSPAPEKVKRCELLGYDSLPKFLKHNEFIRGYYRSEWPLKEAVLSIFSMHNETLNVWTHLVGFFMFLALTVLAAAVMLPGEAGVLSLKHHLRADVHGGIAPLFPLSNASTSHIGRVYGAVNSSTTTASSFSSRNYTVPSSLYLHLPDGVAVASRRFSPANVTHGNLQKVTNGGAAADAEATPLRPVTRWPLFAFLCGAMFCLLASSACHLLSCHSEHASYLMLRLDYAGISALIVTSILPEIYYIFACDPFMQNLYAGGITVCGIATVLVSLIPVFETPEFRFVRSLLFVCMGLLGWVPIAHKHMLFGDRPEAMLTTMYEFSMNCCYGLGVVIYATRVPERWMPGRFDLVGHSHQLFHVLVVAGAYLEYLAVLVYLQWRDMESC